MDENRREVPEEPDEPVDPNDPRVQAAIRRNMLRRTRIEAFRVASLHLVMAEERIIIIHYLLLWAVNDPNRKQFEAFSSNSRQ